MKKQASIRANTINWAFIEKAGMPAKELRVWQSGSTTLPRQFLVCGETTLGTAYVFEDGSGFDTDLPEPVLAWAVLDGF